MASLADTIREQCCGQMFDAGAKDKLLADIQALESDLADALADLDGAAIAADAASLAYKSKCKEVFLAVYKGDSPEHDWLQLCVELGL